MSPEVGKDSLFKWMSILTQSDIKWDRVVSIEEVEPSSRWVYDLTVNDTHNFLTFSGLFVHNTILCLQTLINKASEGKKCLYMSLEESEEKLLTHMEDFGWNARELVKKGKLKIWRINPFDITRNVDALLAKQKGELLIDIDPVILPDDFNKPDFIVIDSLTAIASAFTGKDESYRIYIEQLFRFLEKTNATAFLITETEQIPKIFSPTGVEEFLADGVIVLYNIKHGNVRENALEVLKLRGAGHQKKIVAMQISGEGIVVYPEQEVFSELE
jgi:KaiC/GvpD/RAD55 family RecA-like ATPase